MERDCVCRCMCRKSCRPVTRTIGTQTIKQKRSYSHKGFQAEPKVEDAATDSPVMRVVDSSSQTLPTDSPATVNSSTQWEIELPKQCPVASPPTPLSPLSDLEEDETEDKENDPDFEQPSVSSHRNHKHPAGQQSARATVDDAKYFVFGSELQKLFRFCHQCGAPVKDSNFNCKRTGSLLKVETVCTNGCTWRWTSQPVLSGTSAGNILLSAAILLTGSTYERFAELADVINLKIMAESTFYRIQSKLLFPLINSHFSLKKEALIAAFGPEALVLSGDARCDSPGFSAKYSTYSVMESKTGAVVSFQLNQVNSCHFQSCALVFMGFDFIVGRSWIVIRCTGDKRVQGNHQ